MQQTPKQIQSEQRSMMWSMILIIAVLFGFQYLSKPAQEQAADTQEPAEQVFVKQEEIVTKNIPDSVPHVAVENESLKGRLALNGGVFDALELTKYKQTIAKDSPDVELLSDKYIAYLKWNGSTLLPEKMAEWKVSGETVSAETPVTFTWSGSGLHLTRQISVDDNYMFTIVDTLTNTGKEPVLVSLSGVVSRAVDDVTQERTSVHTGFVSLVDNRLRETAYDGVEKKEISYQTKGGWTGITDKYWQTIFIPDQDQTVEYTNQQQDGWYVASFQTRQQKVMPGATVTKTTHLFAGAKDLNLINAYQKTLDIPKFDLTIDFGWFYFLTKPFLYFLQWLYALVGNMGIAILVFATLLRLALLPIATKSYISMAKMKKIQPQLKELQARYKDDRMRLQQEMVALYKREKVNPAGGCLPMLIQIPVFFALYKVLSVSLQMRQAPFFGWIKDLSAPDPSSVFTLFGLVPWPIPSFLNLGLMPVLMGLTMYIQQRMAPQPAGADKAQMNMFKYMPIIFTFMMGQFAVGLIIYWTWSNILSIAQQKYIMKKVG
ncbi:MAG: membrane protein insertase YidC [Alphaproteobacteria bacterium]|nr:membrane protein insertase YidC [Alphaproteobacteria bacterium]